MDNQELINWILKEQTKKSEEILILGIPDSDNINDFAPILKLQKQIKIFTYKNFDLNEFCLYKLMQNIEHIQFFRELFLPDEEIINWYSYNDERKNGIVNLSEYNIENQNLKLLSVEKKKSISLCNIIKKYKIENKKISLFLFDHHLIKESLLDKVDFKNVLNIIYWNKNKEFDKNIFEKSYYKKNVFNNMLDIWELDESRIFFSNLSILKSDINNKEASLEALKNSNDLLKSQIKDKDSSIDDLNNSNDLLKSQIKDKDFTIDELKNSNNLLKNTNIDISSKNHNNLYTLKKIFPYEIFLDLHEDMNISLDDKEYIFEMYESNKGKFEEYLEDKSIKEYYQDLYRFPLFKFLSSNNKELSNIFIKKSNNQKREFKRRFVKVIGTTKNLAQNQEHNFAKRFTLYNFSSSAMCTFIPKNACTSLRYSFALANGFVRDLDDIDWIHGNNNSQQADENELRNCCYSFIILRSPFTRLSSYFLDKIVGNFGEISANDKSYENSFLNKFCKLENLTFEKYINIIWENPKIIYKDLHTIPQIDFLLFDEYDNWIALEKLSKEINNIELKSEVKFIDTRNHVSNTTKGYKLNSKEYHGDITVKKLRDLKRKNFLPAHANLFNEETSYKLLMTYLSDVFLYIEKTNSYDELKKYLDLSNNYIKKIN